MKTTLLQFIEYLENLATLHVDIAHDPESHPAFIRFYEAKEPEKAARNKIKHFPCIMVRDYDFKFVDNKADNVLKVREAEFLVLDKIGRNNASEDVYELWERTEEIGDEFVIRMKYDKAARLNTTIVDFDLNKVHGVPVDLQPIGMFGTSYTIPISSVRSNDLDTNKWNDQ